mgnify:CR=1 FL=1
MKKKVIFSFFLFFMAANIFSQTVIIMNKENGVYTVPCKINGLSLKFIFDTGASDVSISLTEAMFLKLPVICFDVNTNRASTENNSIYFSDSESLVQELRSLDKDNIEKLGERMYEIAQRRYTWERIVNLYKNSIN